MNSNNARNIQDDTLFTNFSSINTELSNSYKNRQLSSLKFNPSVVNFRDFESIIPPFDASYFQNIDICINNIHDTTSIFNLAELHKSIFVKRSLQRKGQLLVQTEFHTNS